MLIKEKRKMKKPVLVIMAAGMSSRYGGLKQIDPVDPYGHVIIDFSIYDAIRAGFDKVIFVIKKENEKEFKAVIGQRIAKYIEVEYVYQDLYHIPDGYNVPLQRVKPWGTAHAIYCCKDVIDGPFAVINADDYYGKDAFMKIYRFLSDNHEENHFAMVGYYLKHTLTKHGHVSRGICSLDKNDFLTDVIERTHIEKHDNDIAFYDDDHSWCKLSGDSLVSMNIWGFTQSFLDALEIGLRDFFNQTLENNPLKGEYFLPSVVNRLIHQQKANVSVLVSDDQWYGMTYKEDKKDVSHAIDGLKKQGVYPEKLWCGQSEALFHFDLDGYVIKSIPFGNGHINDTYLVTVKKDHDVKYRVILQKMNKTVFTKPQELMENIVNVTSFLRQKIIDNKGDPERETLNVVLTKDQKPYFIDSLGEYWRCFYFIENATSYDLVQDPQDFYQSALAFGHFQYLLADYPARTLHETIPGFHDTKARFEVFKKAVEADVFHRADKVKEEIDFVLAHEYLAHIFGDLMKKGELPLRVTHNDTKLNNVMIDNKTHRAICVIDLDTVMPGLAMNDFGDSIRFGASTALEDEPDLDKVWCDMGLFEIYVQGFIEGCNGKLTKKEIDLLPMGALVMTYECGMRFLTDYLQGDIYFKTHRQDHNLDRCRTQFKLIVDMESKWQQMNDIIKKYQQ